MNAESLEADLTNALGGMDVPILKAELAEEEKLPTWTPGGTGKA